MIFRKTPKGNYIKVDSNTSSILGQNGFIPKYIDNKYIYYVRTKDIIKFIEKEGLKCQN